MNHNLTQEQLARYNRHLILPEIGLEGQQKLLSAKVLIVGTGGLGSPVAFYLAAAGVGTLGLVDFDNVDLSNLQRQILHTNDSVGIPKVDSAEKRLKSINSDVKIVKFHTKITSENAIDVIRDFNIVVGATDTFPTRYLINDACVLLGKPNVYGSIFRFEGQTSVFVPGKGPCYRCLYPEPPPPGMMPSCAEVGVLGILPGVIGLIQATEVVKLVVEKGEPLIGRFLIYDALKMKFRELKLYRDPQCPVCGDRPTITQLIDYEEFCGLQAAASPEQEAKQLGVGMIAAAELKKKLDRQESFLLLDVREPEEYQLARIQGSRLIPLGMLDGHLLRLKGHEEREIIVHCAKGGRSLQACIALKKAGFKNVKNLVGGIEAWMGEIGN